MYLDIFFLCLLEQFINNFIALFVKKRVSNIDSVHLLEESECHAAANDHLIDLVEHILNELNLVFDFCASQDDELRLLWMLEDPSEAFKLLLHKISCSSDLMIDTDHRRVCSVCSPKCIIDK